MLSTSSLPPKLAKRISGQCLYSGCHEPALDASDYCARHDEHERARGARRQQRRRDKLRAKRRCLDCGQPVRSRGLVRCPDCRRANWDRRSVTGDPESVTGDGSDPGLLGTRGVWKLVADPRRPGPARRFSTTRGRGAPTVEERNAEILRDAEHLRLELGRFVVAFGVLTSDEVASLPRIQREEAARETANHAEVAARIAASIHERIDKRGRAECCVCGGPRAGE